MRPALAFSLLLLLPSCETRSRRQPTWGTPYQPQYVVQNPPPSYAMPFAVPAGAGTAPGPAASSLIPGTPAPSTAGGSPERAKCLGEGGAAADCVAALGKLGPSPAAGDGLAIYKRACELKAKQLLGCGAFKSTAVSLERDATTLDLLAQCEGGTSEACEDVKTKSAPLQAWLTTLKTGLCKKGETAHCANYRECKAPARWGCTETGQKLCGCLPKCAAAVTGTPKARTWPDGSTRGAFTCPASN